MTVEAPPNRRPAPTHGWLRRRWADAPVRRKLLSVVLLIGLVCLGPLVGGLMLNARLADARADAQAATRALDELGVLQMSVIDASAAINRYIVLGFADRSSVADFRAAADAAPGQLATLLDDLPEGAATEGDELAIAVEDQLAALETLTVPGAGIGPSGDTIGVDLSAPGVAQTLADLETSFVATTDAYRQVEVLDVELSAIRTDAREEVDRLQRLLVRNTFISVGSALAAAVIGILIVTGDILRRIEALSTKGDRFLRGERLAPPSPANDEIGQLDDKMVYVSTLLESRREDAEAATRAKDEFLQGASHELTGPLTTMVDRGRALADDPDLSPDSTADARHIVRSGHRLQGLIDEMLDIQAIEAGRVDLVIEPVRLPDLTEEAVALVQASADERDITITLHVDDDITVAADHRRLHEVLLNLLSNAVKYNRVGGRVDLTATRRGGMIRTSVRDTGPGVAPDDLPRVFTPFERLGAGDTDVEGTGIGLSLTKHVVEAMDGAIGIDSRPGSGSTFWFDLPVAAGAGQGGERPTSSAELAGAGSTRELMNTSSARGVDDRGVPRPLTPLGRLWLDTPIRLKLLSVVLLVAVVCTPTVAVALVFDARLDETERAAAATAESADQLATIQSTILASLTPIQAYGMTQFTDAAGADEYREASAPLEAQSAELVEGLPVELADPGQTLVAVLSALRRNLDSFTDFGAGGTRPADVDPDPDVFQVDNALAPILVGSVTTIADALQAVEALKDQLAERLTDERDEVERDQGNLVVATLLSMAGSLVAAAGGTYVVTAGLVRRLERLSRNSERFLTDEPMEPERPSTDELGRLSTVTLQAARLVTSRGDAALAATEAKDDFLARVSHELKTPLTAMIGFAQLLEEDPDLTPERRADAATIVREGRRLHTLIKDMLDIRAIELGKLSLAHETVSVSQMAGEALHLIRPAAADRGISVDARCPADIAVRADPRRVREVLFNLASNAMKRIRGGGRVGVTAVRRDGVVRVAVTDTGPGIRPAGEASLMATAGVEADLGGVRLSFTRRLVEVMDGTLGVESTAETGTTFWFELPDADGDPADHRSTTTDRPEVAERGTAV